MLNAILVTAAVLASYLAFYTAYSKANKTLELQLLIDVFTLAKGLDHTLVELNKAISLAGITTLSMAFLPGFEGFKNDLLLSAMVTLWTHSIYSIWKFYGSNNIPALSEWPSIYSELKAEDSKARLQAIKKISVVLGCGLCTLSLALSRARTRSAY
jgi:hypothetical protein